MTVADATPGTVIAASSTLATHDAQDIPDTLRVTDRSPRSGLRIPSLAAPVEFTRGESSSSSGASRSSTRVGVEPLAVVVFDRITSAVYPVSLTHRTSAAAPATPSTVATCLDRSTVASDTPSTPLSASVTQSTQRWQDMPLIARVTIRGLPKSIFAGGSSEGVGEGVTGGVGAVGAEGGASELDASRTSKPQSSTASLSSSKLTTVGSNLTVADLSSRDTTTVFGKRRRGEGMSVVIRPVRGSGIGLTCADARRRPQRSVNG